MNVWEIGSLVANGAAALLWLLSATVTFPKTRSGAYSAASPEYSALLSALTTQGRLSAAAAAATAVGLVFGLLKQ
jgi:hypothetical protein